MSRFYDLGPCGHCGGVYSRLREIQTEPDSGALLAEFTCWVCAEVRYYSITRTQRRRLLEAL